MQRFETKKRRQTVAEDEFDPDGNADQGMIPTLLDVMIGKEAKRWDDMPHRMNQHL